MDAQRRVAVFRNGRTQAVPIPRDFELPGDEAILRREGARLMLEAVPRRRPLLGVLADLGPLGEDFPPIPHTPADPVEL